MGGTVDLPFGLATSVGALPFGSGEDPSADALELVLELQPAFPTAPSSGTVDHSLLAQAVAGLGGVEVAPPGLVRLVGGPAASRPEPVAPIDTAGDAYGPFRSFVAALPAHREQVGSGFVGARVGVLGPVSLALALRAAGVDIDDATRLAGPLVAARAAEVLGALRATMPDDVAAIVLSEPGLIGAMHPTFPLAPSQVLDLLIPVVDALDRHPLAGELLIGAHVPGRTDWETIICSGVSLVSTPAEESVLGWAGALSRFLDDGGRVVWGAVPVDQPLGTGEELLWRRLSAMWCQLVGEGLDPLLLRSRSLTGPVDGLGHFGPTQAERALQLVDSLAVRVRRQAIGARLSLGA